MSRRTSGSSRLDVLAETVMHLDSPSYGDERQRRVMLEATSLGYLVGTYLGLGLAVLAAMTGAVVASFGFFAVATFPAFATLWFARRRGVDMALLAEKDRSARLRALITVYVLLAAWVAGLLVLVLTGHPLLTVGPVMAAGAHGRSTLWGIIAGAVVGSLVAGAFVILDRRRERHSADGDEPDDEF